MKIDGTHFRSLWWDHDASVLEIIDQRWLPHDLRIQPVHSMQDFADAIREMRVRGAPLIGATAAYGMARARLVTGLITERGVCPATPEGLAGLFPELAQAAE